MGRKSFSSKKNMFNTDEIVKPTNQNGCPLLFEHKQTQTYFSDPVAQFIGTFYIHQ